MSYATDGVDWDSPPGWRPGQTTFYVKGVCCPKCGETQTHHKGGNGNSDQDTSRWYCPRCDNRWKMAEKKIGSISIVG